MTREELQAVIEHATAPGRTFDTWAARVDTIMRAADAYAVTCEQHAADDVHRQYQLAAEQDAQAAADDEMTYFDGPEPESFTGMTGRL
jgi:hypothetical protein